MDAEKRIYKIKENGVTHKYPIYTIADVNLNLCVHDVWYVKEVLTEKSIVVEYPKFTYENYTDLIKKHFQECTNLLYPAEMILNEIRKHEFIFNNPHFYKGQFSEATIDEARKFYDSLTLNDINGYLNMLTAIQNNHEQKIIALINEKRAQYAYSMIHNPNSILGKKYTLRK